MSPARFAPRFARALEARRTDPEDRRWLFVAYDQLHEGLGPLATEDPATLGIVLVESRWKAARRPYHRQKLALVLTNLRQFALEQAERGVAVRYVATRDSYADALRGVIRETGPLRALEPAERELRLDLAPLVESGGIVEVRHDGWLTTREQFDRSQGRAGWRMDAFYRHVRRATGVLMEDGDPAGGRWSFDAENRKPWRGTPPAPDPPRFTPDAVTEEAAAFVERSFADHPGAVRTEALPATRGDAETLWRWARRNALEHFGPFEDAMSTRSTGLFHTRISALLNLHRLLPARVVRDVEAMDLPLASKEGFIRQVLGWREFVRHVHLATDGLTRLPGRVRGAIPHDLGNGLPAAFWDASSGLACLDRVVRDVWSESYGHHITRLMVLGNIATLLDASPRELTDWFWVAYQDAYDWVVEPNVLGMATFATGNLFTTKPYIAGSAYIRRMSDYCDGCAFDPGTTCPLTPMYWAWLARHRERLAGLPRMALPLRSLAKRPAARRADDRRAFEWVRDALARGETLTPAALAAAGMTKARRKK